MIGGSHRQTPGGSLGIGTRRPGGGRSGDGAGRGILGTRGRRAGRFGFTLRRRRGRLVGPGAGAGAAAMNTDCAQEPLGIGKVKIERELRSGEARARVFCAR